MNKKILATVGVLVVILVGVTIWMSQRETPEEVAPGFSLGETDEATEEKPTDTEATGDETPAEFQDNLDQAFEDLDAVEL